MYYFYILYSKLLDKYYLGYTSDLNERLKKHNTHHKGFTGKVNDWKVVYSENFNNKNDAFKREQQVKKWKNKSRIETLIKNTLKVK